MDQIAEVREFLRKLLLSKGDRQPFADTSSFFLSGRLASIDAVELVVLLEKKFGIDFGEIGFDESQIDSIEAIQSLVQATKDAV
ncbi:MAG TPA: acyl carrier protein [Methylomirabilota bacterium]|jgi:acyl carrier protein|nr:acyl carrier protein [Methylomirabilota bacterium]